MSICWFFSMSLSFFLLYLLPTHSWTLCHVKYVERATSDTVTLQKRTTYLSQHQWDIDRELGISLLFILCLFPLCSTLWNITKEIRILKHPIVLMRNLYTDQEIHFKWNMTKQISSRLAKVQYKTNMYNLSLFIQSLYRIYIEWGQVGKRWAWVLKLEKETSITCIRLCKWSASFIDESQGAQWNDLTKIKQKKTNQCLTWQWR